MLNHSQRARACRNCSTVKAKCTWISISKCERCNRLGKDCNTQVLARQPNAPKITRVAKIEEKLDGLMTFLNATHQSPPNNHASTSGTRTASDSPSDSLPVSVSASIRTRDSTQPTAVRLGTQVHNQSEPPLPKVSSSSVIDEVFSEGEADRLVDVYRSSLAIQSPFVTVPAGLTAKELYQETPFLFHSILLAASYNNSSRQQLLAYDILKYITEHLILNGERSFDLLQGLLLYIAWYHYHGSGPWQINVQLQLMMALLTDLGLNKASLAREKQDALLDEIKHPERAIPHPSQALYVGHRAALGCFYLFSSINSTMSTLESMRYTSRIDYYLQVVAAAAESEADIVLVQMVNLQKIVEEIRASELYNNSSMKGPVEIYVRYFQAALQEYKTALPTSLQQNTFILLHYFTAEIQLYQIGLQIPLAVEDSLRFQRMEILSACLSASKAFCDVWLSIPPSLYFRLSLVNFGQLTLALLVISRLCVFHAEDWGLSEARGAVHLPSIVEEMIRRMEEASTTFGQEGDICPFTKSAQTLRLGKSWYEAKIAVEAEIVDLNAELKSINAEGVAVGSQFDIWAEDVWQGFGTNWGM